MAIVLAAGESRRMGLPKALLDAGGASFLSRLHRTFADAGAEAIAVLGHDAPRIRAALPPSCGQVENAHWRGGQLTSVRAGLRAALDRGAERLLVHPVDVPLVAAATARRVLEALEKADAVVPLHGKTPGHPLGLTASAATRVLGWEDLPHLEAALARLHAVELEVGDPEILREADTPEEYAAMFGHPPRLHVAGPQA